MQLFLIAIAVLARSGSGTLSRAELERLCISTAQRISMLHDLNAPDFYDRAIFRGFIAQLRNIGILSNNRENKLVFDKRIEQISTDAQFILGETIRSEIDRLTPLEAIPALEEE